MNIKSLLLGSAAALIAVSGARAADAVTVAEPEPAEYVKICDVYGSVGPSSKVIAIAGVRGRPRLTMRPHTGARRSKIP